MIGLRKRDSAKKMLRHRSAAPSVRSAGTHVERLEARLMLAAEVSPLSIHLDLGPSLEANAPARAAILRAAKFWEGVLFDPVAINIDAEMTNDFPSNNTLALTNSTPVRFLYGDVRSRLIADASADESIVELLPTPEQLRFDLADDFRMNLFTDDVVVELTRANALALGFTDLPVHPDLANVVDASIKFNNFADFDFDNSDGVDSGSLDFEAVALHEIAHALGFLSNVDDVDFHLELGTPRPRVDPTVMDLFRLAPDEGDDFSTARRILNTGDAVPVQVFHDGQFDVSVFSGVDIGGLQTGDIPMATGQQFGDGKQASHLKADDDTGVLLGLLNPIVSRSRIGRISEIDMRILGLIGWDWHEGGQFGEPPEVTVDPQVTANPQPELSGSLSETDAQVLVRLPEAFGINRAKLEITGDPAAPGAFVLTNRSESPAKISRVEIVLPHSGIAPQGNATKEPPFFDTFGSSGDGSQDFKADATSAENVGLLSPASDDLNDKDVADSTKTLTLTFDDFDPGESLEWQIDVDGEIAAISGEDLVGGRVTVYFEDGSVATGTLIRLSDDAARVNLFTDHLARATNNGDGTWTLPAGSFDPLAPGLYNVEVTVIDSSGARATDDGTFELRVFPEGVSGLPTVEAVFVGSTQWNSAMRTAVGELGVSIPSGAEQFVPLRWTELDQISVQFSQDVIVSVDDLTLTGVNAARYETADFRYDALSHVATWTLTVAERVIGKSLRADKLLLELSAAIHDESFKPLDGNWASGASSFPSGNGQLESDDRFAFRINVLPGDVSGDGEVTRRDLLDMLRRLATSSGSGLYDPRLDLTGNGLIDLDDLRGVVHRLGFSLPSGDPASTGGAAALIATDAVFERLGAAPAPENAADEAPAIGQPAFATAAEESRPLASTGRPRRLRAIHRRVARSTIEVGIQDMGVSELRESTLARRLRARRR